MTTKLDLVDPRKSFQVCRLNVALCGREEESRLHGGIALIGSCHLQTAFLYSQNHGPHHVLHPVHRKVRRAGGPDLFGVRGAGAQGADDGTGDPARVGLLDPRLPANRRACRNRGCGSEVSRGRGAPFGGGRGYQACASRTGGTPDSYSVDAIRRGRCVRRIRAGRREGGGPTCSGPSAMGGAKALLAEARAKTGFDRGAIKKQRVGKTRLRTAESF